MHAIPPREHRKISSVIHNQSAATPHHHLTNHHRIPQHLLRPTQFVPVLQQLHPSQPQLRNETVEV
jgi:hypothetical protein